MHLVRVTRPNGRNSGPGRGKILCPPCVAQNGAGAHLAFYPMGMGGGGLSPGLEAYNLLPPCVEVKNTLSIHPL
jgi:hypothetical protein